MKKGENTIGSGRLNLGMSLYDAATRVKAKNYSLGRPTLDLFDAELTRPYTLERFFDAPPPPEPLRLWGWPVHRAVSR